MSAEPLYEVAWRLQVLSWDYGEKSQARTARALICANLR
jgi:hypothetical protein